MTWIMDSQAKREAANRADVDTAKMVVEAMNRRKIAGYEHLMMFTSHVHDDIPGKHYSLWVFQDGRILQRVQIACVGL